VISHLLTIAATAQLAVAAAPPQQPAHHEAARRVASMLALAAQEYRLAYSDGRIVNEAEAEEARLFASEAAASLTGLPPSLATELEAEIAGFRLLLAAVAPPDSLAERARGVARQLTVALGLTLDERPSREASLAAGERIFQRRCANCHGASGRGDGGLAPNYSPPPANLADPATLASSTPLDFYRKVTLGVPGTAMKSFSASLSREERWDVVAYVLTLSDSTARRGRSGGAAIVFGTVRGSLGGGMDLARRGQRESASRAVLDAYLAFEAVEGTLQSTEPGLAARAEGQFADLRIAAAGGADEETLDRGHRDLLATLEEAESALARSRSPAGLVVESVLLMLREGTEAILVIAAIMAVLLKSGAPAARRRAVRWGVGAALVASLLTAGLLEWIFRVSPARREALEGAVMLLAAAMLFYVSYWVVSKIEVAAWQRFVKEQVRRAAARGGGLALASVVFLAVYREGFETVLFYKALYVAGGSAGAAAVTFGLLAGLAGLVALYVGIERFGLRIPVRQFFMVTGALLYYLAFVFAGRGVKELQESGLVATTPVSWAPRSDLLGIYPTVESLAVQGLIVLALLAALAWVVLRPKRQPAAAAIAARPSSVPAPRPTEPAEESEPEIAAV
jgi:high-affinity iron transporter